MVLLEKIVRSMKEIGLTILLIFYDVEASDVQDLFKMLSMISEINLREI